MDKAKNAIAAPTSRRNFLRAGSAVIAALTVPAIAHAAPSIEAEIASLVTEFESHGYKLLIATDRGRSCGVLLRFPDGPRKWDNAGHLAAWNKWDNLKHCHKAEFADYLIKTGRTESIA